MTGDDHDHEHEDGCLCDTDHAEHVLTKDVELPAAQGGVQGDRKPKAPAKPRD